MTEKKSEGATRGKTLLKCPSCGLPPNDVRGDPFERSEFMPASEVNLLVHCDNGHAWFEAVRWDHDGKVTGHVSGMAGTRSPWAQEASNASGGAAAPQSQNSVAGFSGEKERGG